MDQLPWKAGLSCASITLMVQSVMTSGMSWRQQLCVHSSDLPPKVQNYFNAFCFWFIGSVLSMEKSY